MTSIPADPADDAVMPSEVAATPDAASSASQPPVTPPSTTQPSAPGGFAFLLNVASVEPAAGIEIAPKHVLRRADPAEIATIKTTLAKIATPFQMHVTFFWEHRWPHPGGTVEILPPDAWRYFVVAFPGTNATIHELERAFALADVELLVGFVIISIPPYVNQGMGMHSPRLFHALEQTGHDDWQFHTVTTAVTDEIQQLHQALQSHDNQVLDLRRVLSELANLRGMPYESPLRFLGYFALLESLLTHPPKQTDPYDSITRQVKKKLALLNRRFARPLDYKEFGVQDGDKLWGAMYSLRSAVAHGGTPDFAKDLKLLKSRQHALSLLQRTVRAVIRQTLKEPQLLVDLKEC